MKKMLTFAALASMMFVSCVNDESASFQEQKQLLSFSAPTMKTQTRAEVLGEITGVKYPDAEKFMIFSKSYNNDFAGWMSTTGITDYFDVDGEITTKGQSYWTTNDTHYWPGGSLNLAFMAYSPSDAGEDGNITIDNSGLKISNFQTKDNVSDQYDLLYSSMMYGLNTKQHSEHAIPVHFKHALSSITFSAQGSDEAKDLTYKIKGIKIFGKFQVVGNFTQTCSDFDNVPTVDNQFPEDFGTVEWSFEKNTVDEEQEYSITLAQPVTITHTEPIRYVEGVNAWLPIPQTVPEDARIQIFFDIVNTSAGTTRSYSPTVYLREFAYTENGQTKNITEWEPGKRYTYRVEFGGTKAIFFDPSITDWISVPTAIYTLSGY